MGDWSSYWSVTCCIIWILSTADANVITTEAGSRVMMPCNTSNVSFQQITWKLNRSILISFRPVGDIRYTSPEARELQINMSLTGNETFPLLIDHAQMSHTGIYTCTLFSVEGRWEQRWELLVTEKTSEGWWSSNQYVMFAALTVVSVCCLTFIITLKVLRVRKTKEPVIEPAVPVSLQEQTGDIYENCLDVNYCNRSSRGHHVYEAVIHQC